MCIFCNFNSLLQGLLGSLLKQCQKSLRKLTRPSFPLLSKVENELLKFDKFLSCSNVVSLFKILICVNTQSSTFLRYCLFYFELVPGRIASHESYCSTFSFLNFFFLCCAVSFYFFQSVIAIIITQATE